MFVRILNVDQLKQNLIAGNDQLTFHFQDEDIQIKKILRLVVDKRAVMQGVWRNRIVLIKIFFSNRARRHVRREIQGSNLIRESGVLTPKLLASGGVCGGKASLLLFDYVVSTVDLESIWQGGNEELLKPLVLEMQSIISQLHNKGLLHVDLHPHNFILSDKGLYLIDVAEVKRVYRSSPVRVNKSLKNIVSLYAQLAIKYRRLIDDLFVIYCQQRQWALTKKVHKKMQRVLFQLRRYRIKNTIRRSFRICSNLVYHKTWRERYAYQREYCDELVVKFFRQIDTNILDRNIIKKGNTCTVACLEFCNQLVIVKRYNIKSWWHGIKKCWYKSRAARSWQNANVLSVLGIKTAKPIAFYEKRFLWFFHWKSYFLCEFQHGETLEHYLQTKVDEDQRKMLVEKVVSLFRSFFSIRMAHGDLKATNFIVNDSQIMIVDLDSIKFYHRARSFLKAFQVDIDRFLNNWQDGSEERSMFEESVMRLWE